MTTHETRDDDERAARCAILGHDFDGAGPGVLVCDDCKLVREGLTVAEKYAAIVGLLKDGDEWRENVSGADFVQDVSILIAAPTLAAPEPAVWWIVTLREHGDDEESLYIVQANDATAAQDAARSAFIVDNYDDADTCASCGESPCAESCGACDYPAPTIYLNHVVRCEGAEPVHVLNP